jgi:hypothetical protein
MPGGTRSAMLSATAELTVQSKACYEIIKLDE